MSHEIAWSERELLIAFGRTESLPMKKSLKVVGVIIVVIVVLVFLYFTVLGGS